MRRKDESKDQLIRSIAMKMIVKEGFDGFSMHKLAKAAGLSPATLYIYFIDREDLIMSICSEEVNNMARASLAGFDPESSFSDGIRIQWLNRARYCLKYPERMSFLEQMRHSALRDKFTNLAANDFKNAMHAFLNNAIQRKELVNVPIEVFWSVAFAPLYNLVKFHNEKSGVGCQHFQFSEEIMLQTLNLVIKALTP